jgi:integrase
VTIKEKKKDRSKEMTFRTVPMTPKLRQTMSEWFAEHPGRQLTVCQRGDLPLTVQRTGQNFRRVLEGSKWVKLPGWYIFRHSFASNCAAKGIDQRLIDGWMGHQTEEMRRRYRHLFLTTSRWRSMQCSVGWLDDGCSSSSLPCWSTI